MKRWSIKTKIALWFTLIIFLISLLACGTGLMFYGYIIESQKQSVLELHIAQKADEAQKHFDLTGKPEWLYENDVMYFIYDSTGKRIAGEGKISSYALEKLDQEPVMDEWKRHHRPYIDVEQERFLIQDMKFTGLDGQQYWLRGMIYLESSFPEIWDHISNNKQLLPPAFLFFLTVSFLGGYWLTGRFLAPVKKISRTVKEIRESGDLSKRIGLEDTGDELHELASVFDSMFDRVEKNFEAEKQFTSNASHELRTPLSVILSQCEYALEDAETEEELLQALSDVQIQGYKISHLIEALLLLTRIEQQTERYPIGVIDISALVCKTCGDYCLIGEKNIALVTDVVPHIMLNGNEELFTLMVSNLIGNAYKYGRENGNIKVSLKAQGRQILFEVADNGAGISQDDLPHIWERFYRSDKSRHSKGLGLGLSLVKQIAEFHGGTVSAESIAGKGSSFCVVFMDTA